MLHGDGGFGRDALGQEHAGGVEEGLAAGGQELAAIGQVGAELAAALAGFRDDDEKGARHVAPPQHEGAVPATGQNTLRLPKCALSAPSQRKPLESHDLVTTARVHHDARRRGCRVAVRGARATTGEAADDRILRHEHARSTESMDRRILQRLREVGWIEGRTVAVEYRWAQGRTERYDESAAELVRLNVDVIVTTMPTVAALKHATSVIPIVFGGRARARRTA